MLLLEVRVVTAMVQKMGTSRMILNAETGQLAVCTEHPYGFSRAPPSKTDDPGHSIVVAMVGPGYEGDKMGEVISSNGPTSVDERDKLSRSTEPNINIK